MMDGVSPETCWASYKYEIKFWYTVASSMWTSAFLQVLWIQFFLSISCLSHAWAHDIQPLILILHYVKDTLCSYLLASSWLLCPNYLVSTRDRCPTLRKEVVKFHDRISVFRVLVSDSTWFCVRSCSSD